MLKSATQRKFNSSNSARYKNFFLISLKKMLIPTIVFHGIPIASQALYLYIYKRQKKKSYAALCVIESKNF